MLDEDKTKEELLQELLRLRQQVSDFKNLEQRHREAEEALKQQLSFLQKLIDTIPNPIFYKNVEGIYQGCNKAYEECLGRPKEEIIGKNVFSIFSPEMAKNYHEMDMELLRNPGFQAYETTVAYADGTVRDVILNKATFTNNDGTLAGFVGVIVDLSEHKKVEAALRESERRLADIINFLPDYTFAVDLEGRVIVWNRAIEEITGVRAEDIMGKPNHEYALPFYGSRRPGIVELVLNPDHPVAKEYTVLHMEDGAMVMEGYVRAAKYDREIYIWGKASPLYDANGNVVGAIETFRDITERKNLERGMAWLDRLNLVGEMAAGIGHELRNPMTTVRGFLQVLGGKPECQQYKEYFDLMIEELDRANSIISEFLSLARNKAIDLRPQNLNRIIESITPLIQADAMVRDCSVKIEPGIIPDLLLDEKEIRQLILNLTRNGLDAMPAGRTLTISTFVSEGTVSLAVRDEGSGIDPSLLERLGTPFLTTKENGTGLGLAICYSIAARHRATIGVETGPAGTTFTIRFPCRPLNPLLK
ncbi:MAG: PAS domain S-box protein [Syntrophomonadaceae bacterium]|nr:PAS domain S-box protein [Syntrophomonadaceae bacterium]